LSWKRVARDGIIPDLPFAMKRIHTMFRFGILTAGALIITMIPLVATAVEDSYRNFNVPS
jgi:hypothetical protein